MIKRICLLKLLLPSLIAKICRSFKRLDLYQEWHVEEGSMLCSDEEYLRVRYCGRSSDLTVSNLSRLLEDNWLTDRHQSNLTVSLRDSPPNTMAYFSFKQTEYKHLWGTYRADKLMADNVTLCYNTLYLMPDELTSAPNPKLAFEDHVTLLVALLMAIACFSPDYGPFAVSFMSAFAVGSIVLARYFVDCSFELFVLSYLLLLGLSCLWGYFNFGLCSKAMYIAQSVLTTGVQLLAWTDDLRRKYWELDYLVWMTVGVFLFCAAKVGCTNPALTLFVLQSLKYSQLLMVWLGLYTNNPAETRLRLAEFPSYYKRYYSTEAMAYGYLKKLLIAFFVLSVVVALILGHRNRRRAIASASLEAGLIAVGLEDR